MAGPKHQHFIPKSYLKNFSNIEGDKAFVETMNVQTNEIKSKISINDICVSKNIYTLPDVKGEGKYALERYYGENVDGVYPDVYKLLTDDTIIEISSDDRHKILSTALSLYFRTDKFLNRNIDSIKNTLNEISNIDFKQNPQVPVVVNGKEYVVEEQTMYAVLNQIKIDTKLAYLIGHLEDWENFVEHKYQSQISVYRVSEEIPLITCDNPVDIYNPTNSSADIFDPANSIQLPLDQYHYLWISPNTEPSKRNIIYRGMRDKWFALTSNSTMQHNATNFIISKASSLQQHLNQQSAHNTETPENLEAAESIKFRNEQLMEFVAVVSSKGLRSRDAIEKFKELRDDGRFKEDQQFQQFNKMMSDKGLL